MSNDILRRIDMHRMVPVEIDILKVMQDLEKLPADTRLSEAVDLLEKARNKVADFVDGVANPAPLQIQPKLTLTRTNIRSVKPTHIKGKCFSEVELIGITVEQLKTVDYDLYIALVNTMLTTKGSFTELQGFEGG